MTCSQVRLAEKAARRSRDTCYLAKPGRRSGLLSLVILPPPTLAGSFVAWSPHRLAVAPLVRSIICTSTHRSGGIIPTSFRPGFGTSKPNSGWQISQGVAFFTRSQEEPTRTLFMDSCGMTARSSTFETTSDAAKKYPSSQRPSLACRRPRSRSRDRFTAPWSATATPPQPPGCVTTTTWTEPSRSRTCRLSAVISNPERKSPPSICALPLPPRGHQLLPMLSAEPWPTAALLWRKATRGPSSSTARAPCIRSRVNFEPRAGPVGLIRPARGKCVQP